MTLTRELPGRAVARTGRGQALSSAQWRDLLEARWRDRLHELTELCVRFHEARPPPELTQEQPSLRRLMRRAVAARQALAETDAALRRVTSGTYGRCEDCSGEIPGLHLRTMPETRYCPRCAAF